MTLYSSSGIDSASVTCHECGGVSEIHSIEWPPPVHVCNYCEAVYKFASMDKEGRVTWTLIRPEWEDD